MAVGEVAEHVVVGDEDASLVGDRCEGRGDLRVERPQLRHVGGRPLAAGVGVELGDRCPQVGRQPFGDRRHAGGAGEPGGVIPVVGGVGGGVVGAVLVLVILVGV